MKINNFKIKHILFFRQWTRKTFSVFYSIGKVIEISFLKIKISQSFISKNKSIFKMLSYFINILTFNFIVLYIKNKLIINTIIINNNIPENLFVYKFINFLKSVIPFYALFY